MKSLWEVRHELMRHSDAELSWSTKNGLVWTGEDETYIIISTDDTVPTPEVLVTPDEFQQLAEHYGFVKVEKESNGSTTE